MPLVPSKKDRHVFWLNGPARTGKSAITQTFAETSFADGKLGASFFCSRDFTDGTSLRNLPNTRVPAHPTVSTLLTGITSSLGARGPDVGRESLCSQVEKIVTGPLKAARIQTLIIINAIDKCGPEEPASAILSILSCYMYEIPSVKFFIAGRPEPRIHSGLLRLSEIAKTRSDCDFP